MNPSRQLPPSEITLAHPCYQPSNAEKVKPIELPKGTTPDDLDREPIRPTRVRYFDQRERRRSPSWALSDMSPRFFPSHSSAPNT